MTLRLLADIVVLIHFAVVIFVTSGGLLVLYRRWIAWIHISLVLWSSIVNLASWVCPLTPLENLFRMAAGQAGYDGGFIEYYIIPLIYPGGMPRELELVAGVSILVWNVFVYLLIIWWFKQPWRWRGSDASIQES